MGLEDMKYNLDVLSERELAEVKGLSIFSRYAVTDKGLALLSTCEQIYEPEGDVKQYLAKIHEAMGEKTNDKHL